MPIEYKKKLAVMYAVVSVDEADGLLDWLQNKPGAKVDFGDCSHLHPANLIVLMAAQCRVVAWPVDPGLRAWLETALQSNSFKEGVQ